MNATDVIAIVTAIVSAVIAALSAGTSFLSLRTARDAEDRARDAERRGRMPVLICPSSNVTITVRNVGNGPALNIAIARAEEKLAAHDASEISFDQLTQTSWSNPAHLQPIEPGETVVRVWEGGPAVGLSYTDALGFPYTTLASRHGTRVFDGNAMGRLKLSGLPYPPQPSGSPDDNEHAG